MLDPERRSSRRARWVEGIALVCGFWVLREAILRVAAPPDAIYFGRTILEGALRSPEFLAVLLLPAILPLVRWRETRWSSVTNGGALRVLIGFLCLVFAWAYSTYEYNVYFDRWHALDRALLAALAACTLLHPAFVTPFLALLVAVAGQFQVPLGGFTWTDKILPFEVLLLFVVHAQLWALRRPCVPAFVSLAIVLTAAHYVVPAFGKLAVLWPLRDEIHALVACAHMNGWFAAAGEERVLAVLALLRPLAPLLRAGAIVLELAPVLLAWRVRAYRYVLPGCVLLHLGIFLASGIFFWKWILLDAALFAFLWRAGPELLERVSEQRRLAAVSLVTAPLWLSPVDLTWFDTRLTYCFELDAVGESGTVYRVSRDFLAPYDVVFAQNRFAYLTHRATLVGTFGSTADHALAEALRNASPAEIDRMEAAAESAFDAERALVFDDFVRTFFGNLNRRGSERNAFGWFAAPHHIRLQRRGRVYALQEPVTEVRVVLERRLYTGRSLELLSSETLRTVVVPRSGDG